MKVQLHVHIRLSTVVLKQAESHFMFSCFQCILSYRHFKFITEGVTYADVVTGECLSVYVTQEHVRSGNNEEARRLLS